MHSASCRHREVELQWYSPAMQLHDGDCSWTIILSEQCVLCSLGEQGSDYTIT